MAIDAGSHRLYAYSSPYCTPTYPGLRPRALTEDENSVASGANSGIAVDEATDTLFLTAPASGEFSAGQKVTEWRVDLPLVTTGNRSAIRETRRLGRLSTAPGKSPNAGSSTGPRPNPSTFTKEAHCEPSLPYTVDQPTVTADLTGTLTGETPYYYRFVAKNAEGIGRGAVRSFTPHNVSL